MSSSSKKGRGMKVQGKMPSRPANSGGFTLEEQQRANRAFEALTNREQLVWDANYRNDSIAQSERQFTQLLHRPNTQTQRSEPLFKDATYGQRIPEEMKKFLENEEYENRKPVAKTAKGRNATSIEDARKGKQRALPESSPKEQEEARKHTDDEDDEQMDVDEVEEEGGVPLPRV